MKLYDCSQCKNKENHLFRHCTFYENEDDRPDWNCVFFIQKPNSQDLWWIQQSNDDIIRKRSIELVNLYQDLGINSSTWIQAINNALQKHFVNFQDTMAVANFVRSFGDDGLLFSCDNCGNVIELEDDSNVYCDDCGHSEVSLIS